MVGQWETLRPFQVTPFRSRWCTTPFCHSTQPRRRLSDPYRLYGLLSRFPTDPQLCRVVRASGILPLTVCLRFGTCAYSDPWVVFGVPPRWQLQIISKEIYLQELFSFEMTLSVHYHLKRIWQSVVNQKEKSPKAGAGRETMRVMISQPMRGSVVWVVGKG